MTDLTRRALLALADARSHGHTHLAEALESMVERPALTPLPRPRDWFFRVRKSRHAARPEPLLLCPKCGSAWLKPGEICACDYEGEAA